MNLYEFYAGKEFEAYEYLGAHFEGNKLIFRTFAPNAAGVTMIAECNNWDAVEMYRIHDGSIFECIIDNGYEGMMYKYRIYTRDGGFTDHCDPYGFGMEGNYGTASVVRDIKKYKFHDTKWMKQRSVGMDQPINIYEVHAGSWMRNHAGEKNAEGKPYEEFSPEEISEQADVFRGQWYSYKELAELMIPYLKDMGYNYVEFLPLAEHPCDNSWGYQCTGFFAPTFRYGTAQDLQEMVDLFHQNKIGVLLDFVPVHFAVDGYALANYDGTSLYEYPSKDISYNEWGSKNFNHSKGEVRSFLQSAANYWLSVYHFDGLRMDAISNMIYWQGDSRRGVNKNAVDFLKNMNYGLKQRHPSCILSAEDSTSYLKVTAPVEYDGMGFDYKWDMGWMNDTLDYFRKDPIFRGGEGYNMLTFSMMYYYQENYLLPLSHDETVHGKASIVQKMFGLYGDKFRQAKAFYMYMYLHPGKKLNFMGNELGQLREWTEEREQDWFLLKYPMHDSFHKYIKVLNGLYMKNPALYAEEMSEAGFEWVDCNRKDQCIYVIERKTAGKRILGILNFSGTNQSYQKYLENVTKMSLLLDSDWECYSGETPKGKTDYNFEEHNFTVNMKPYSGMIFSIS